MDTELQQYLDNKLAGLLKKEDLVDFATKSDLVNFATKSDLVDFATKRDLANFATKSDLASLATKSDLDEFATRQDFRNLEIKLDAIQETLHKTDVRDKEDSNAFAKDILNHDTRITKLETDMHVLQLQNTKA